MMAILGLGSPPPFFESHIFIERSLEVRIGFWKPYISREFANASAASQAAAITQGEAQNANVAAAAQAAEIFQGVVNAENNAADIAALRPLQIVLHTIVGLT